MQYLIVYALLHTLENMNDWLGGIIENNNACCVVTKEREFDPLIHITEVITVLFSLQLHVIALLKNS